MDVFKKEVSSVDLTMDNKDAIPTCRQNSSEVNRAVTSQSIKDVRNICLRRSDGSDEETGHGQEEMNYESDSEKSDLLYNCSECSSRYRCARGMRRHYRTHFPTSLIPASCPICDKIFRNLSYLRSCHLRLHTLDSTFACSHCDKKFTSHVTLSRHALSHETSLCNVCGKLVRSSRIKVHAANHKRHHRCAICSKEFNLAWTLEQHMIAHRNHEPCQCSVCGHRSSNGYRMKQHMLHHAEKTFPCPLCSKLFATMPDVTQHIRIHDNANAVKCTICEKTLSSNTKLNRHMLVHTGKKPFECSECGRTFTRNHYLKEHCVMKHGVVFSFKCDYCRTSFSTEDLLSQHSIRCSRKPKAVEKVEQEFPCIDCGRVFHKKSHLTTHSVIHSDSRQSFSCSICSRTFLYKYSVRSHMRKVHRTDHDAG